jgi:hypothetical protein
MPRWCIDRLTKVYDTRVEDFYRAANKGALDKYPPGIIGVPSAFLGRYREFDICLGILMTPPGCEPGWGLGLNTAKTMNDFARKLLERDFQWLWIIGDDHVFTADIIYQLLERDKDIVAPFCCRRNYPYDPVVHEDGSNGEWGSVTYDWFEGKSGLVKLNDTKKIAGNAGMLIKRKVFETLDDPWFEMGKIKPEYGAPDLWFARKAVDAGFDIWLDMDHPIGHISHMSVWPYLDPETNRWKAEMRYPDDVWGERGLIVD